MGVIAPPARCEFQPSVVTEHYSDSPSGTISLARQRAQRTSRRQGVGTMNVNLEVVSIPVSDVVATREELAQRGVNITEVYHGQGSPFFPAARISGPDPNRASYNSYASFEDPDGNGWTLQEVTSRLPGREPGA